jgi:hypothetical protein
VKSSGPDRPVKPEMLGVGKVCSGFGYSLWMDHDTLWVVGSVEHMVAD